MPLHEILSTLFILILTSVLPAGPGDQYRITLTQGMETGVVLVQRTPTGLELSDEGGLLIARALSQTSPLVYQVSSQEGEERIDLKGYLPTLTAPLPADQSSLSLLATDGGKVDVTRQGQAIVLRFSALPDFVARIEPR
ncbi:hypothetical protein DYH09_08445 [bacterium CPR1]|nr:hypothetical protein [bacterium CPR1]